MLSARAGGAAAAGRRGCACDAWRRGEGELSLHAAAALTACAECGERRTSHKEGGGVRRCGLTTSSSRHASSHARPVVERPLEWLSQPGFRLVQGLATGVDERRKARSRGSPRRRLPLTRSPQLLLVRTRDGCETELPYDRLCIAAGARPRQLPQAAACGAEDRVITLRDTDSVGLLALRLRDARRVMVVGNGGIAMELMCAMKRPAPSFYGGLTPPRPPARLCRACIMRWCGLCATRASETPSLIETRCALASLARQLMRSPPLDYARRQPFWRASSSPKQHRPSPPPLTLGLPGRLCLNQIPSRLSPAMRLSGPHGRLC